MEKVNFFRVRFATLLGKSSKSDNLIDLTNALLTPWGIRRIIELQHQTLNELSAPTSIKSAQHFEVNHIILFRNFSHLLTLKYKEADWAFRFEELRENAIVEEAAKIQQEEKLSNEEALNKAKNLYTFEFGGPFSLGTRGSITEKYNEARKTVGRLLPLIAKANLATT